MDNLKMGIFIAKLRKQKNLTQQELGELVGVGCSAVSKWERGISVPDISLIDKLCSVLEVSSKELLRGEFSCEDDEGRSSKGNSNHTNTDFEKDDCSYLKIKKKRLYLIIALGIILVGLVLGLILMDDNESIEVYELVTTDEDKYYVSGMVITSNNKISVIISSLNVNDEEFNNLVIKNYEYSITCGSDEIYNYGYIGLFDYLDNDLLMGDFLHSFKVDYTDEYSEGVDDNSQIILSFRVIVSNDVEKSYDFTFFLKKI